MMKFFSIRMVIFLGRHSPKQLEGGLSISKLVLCSGGQGVVLLLFLVNCD